MQALVIALAVLASTTGTTSPAELLSPDVPAEFELADGAAADLTFEEYAPLAPQSVAHVEATSAEALAMRAAVDVWTAGDGDILLREITMWTTDDAARAYVEQSVVVGTENELDEARAPFDGGIAFFGADEGLWTRTLTWRQGPYGITVSHFSIEEGTDRTIVVAAESLATNIEAETGDEIADSESSPEPADAPATSTGGGIPIGTVLFWLVLIVGGIWLLMKIKRMLASRGDGARPRRAGAAADDDPDGDPGDVDELIEKARARSRAEREVESIPDPTADRNPTGHA